MNICVSTLRTIAFPSSGRPVSSEGVGTRKEGDISHPRTALVQAAEMRCRDGGLCTRLDWSCQLVIEAN